MIVQADNVQRAGWAPRDPKTRHILLAHISEDEGEARALLKAMKERYPERHAWQVVPVLVTVSGSGLSSTAAAAA